MPIQPVPTPRLVRRRLDKHRAGSRRRRVGQGARRSRTRGSLGATAGCGAWSFCGLGAGRVAARIGLVEADSFARLRLWARGYEVPDSDAALQALKQAKLQIIATVELWHELPPGKLADFVTQHAEDLRWLSERERQVRGAVAACPG